MRGARILLVIFLFVFVISLVSASYEFSNKTNHSIDEEYAMNGTIKGWVNASFDSADATLLFEDSRDNSISLGNLLGLDDELDYTCVPIDCESDYTTSNGETEKTFSLASVESKLVGFKFSGDIDNINSVDFTIESDAGSSCTNQLEIDIANEKVKIGNSKSTSEVCGSTKDKGCFDDGESANNYQISEYPSKHCQRVEFSASPGFEIGAWVKPKSDARTLTMDVRKVSNFESVDSCELVNPVSEGEVSCGINLSLTSATEYYVCISSDGAGDFEIRGYSTDKGCGFHGASKKPEIAAFDIFAKGKKFDSVGILQISNSISGFETIGGKVGDYLQEKYQFDCTTTDCVVPVLITANSAQAITIKNLTIVYETGLGSTTTDKFYDLEEIPAKVSSDFQKIFLDDAGFYVPNKKGEYKFRLKFDRAEIFEKEVLVGNIPIIEGIVFTAAAAAVPTEFEVKVNSSREIIKYEWDFGDNTTDMTTTTNKVSKTYSAIDIYELTVTVTDENQKSATKTFEINVGSPEEVINETIFEMKKSLESVNSEIETFDSFEEASLKSVIDVEGLNEELTNIEQEYETAKAADDEEDIIEVATKLFELKIPESIRISESGNAIPFYFDEGVVDVGIVNSITGSSGNSEYEEAIVAWGMENIDMTLDYEGFFAQYGNSGEVILKVFELTVSKKTDLDYDSYLIFDELVDLKFKQSYSEKVKDGYVYIKLDKGIETIVFSTTEDVSFEELPVFVSPSINKLSVFEEDADDKPFLLAWFALAIFLVIIIGFVVYIILQEWYKKKYENHLFRNKNDLYNIISYVNNMRAKGMEDFEITKKLRASGWGAEQVRYAVRKYADKRTGMVEIPIHKIVEKLKGKDEVPKPRTPMAGTAYRGRVPRRFRKI